MRNSLRLFAAALLLIGCSTAAYPRATRDASHHVQPRPDVTGEAGYQIIDGLVAGSEARIFYVSYAATHEAAGTARPIIFAYNGGPGGSSAGVHIGAFGPRVVAPIEPDFKGSPSDRLVTNPDSLTKSADLVFIDPVGSGLSRTLPGSAPAAFYGVQADAAATAAFITGYLQKHGGRERSVFIMGESYGTLRTVLAARLLQQRGIRPAGLILMGLILDNATLFEQPGNDEPYWLFLPSEAATARYHGKANAGRSLSDTVASAEAFATNPYLGDLSQGSTLSPTALSGLRANLSKLLGQTTDTERVTPDQFAHHLLDDGLVISRADGRFAGLSHGAGVLADPLYATMLPLYERAMVRYLRDDLGVTGAADYQVLDTRVADNWQWGETPLGSPNALNVSGTLRDTLHADPNLTVFVASGIYDLTSPMLAADYTLRHLGGTPAELVRIVRRRYESGHMIYVSGDARHRLSSDISAFIRARMSN